MSLQKLTLIGQCNFGLTRDKKFGPNSCVLKLLQMSGMETGGNMSQRVRCKLHLCTVTSIDIGPLSSSVTSELPFKVTIFAFEEADQF